MRPVIVRGVGFAQHSSTCWKNAFATRGLAFASIEGQRHRKGMSAYECHMCRFWHIGHKQSETYRRERAQKFRQFVYGEIE